jgi:hypothetical protein
VAEQPTEAELREQLEQELRKLKIGDLLLQTLYTVSQLAYRRLSPEDRDLDQARLGIEALRALLPVLEGSIPADATRDFNQVTANLQLAYAAAAVPQPPASPGPEESKPPASAEHAEPDDAG